MWACGKVGNKKASSRGSDRRDYKKARQEKIALALKDIVAAHPNFQLAELVKILNEKILKET